MFPSFKSLRDRKNKLRQLAAENSDELQLARIKNDRYKLTQWATDLEKTIDTSTLQQLLRKVAPSLTTTGIQASPTMTTMGIQATPSMTATGIQAAPSMSSTGLIDEEDSLSDIDDTQSTYDFGTINPILNSGTPDKNVYIGTDGKLFNVNNGKQKKLLLARHISLD
ncbi:uncharacterized protein PITG_01630 [Phytophthora infestans T30-4]|uniref:Uncharacterized protein n=1 Tax=Phytophthora infestans (strain T30-4) TaxID=403677 RepID=D0MTP4_PHYIT|nr:uncharacterized protein PITG_01630 [Phytophthora infestans T30-4]EEY61341.1 hypothetical protein PITG_01630 [Phytophthora infestans T30-4]|eukprot:XP_002908258.1 hypothetical protein PITG_01630 [Phytophthora infestans T30-4]